MERRIERNITRLLYNTNDERKLVTKEGREEVEETQTSSIAVPKMKVASRCHAADVLHRIFLVFYSHIPCPQTATQHIHIVCFIRAAVKLV